MQDLPARRWLSGGLQYRLASGSAASAAAGDPDAVSAARSATARRVATTRRATASRTSRSPARRDCTPATSPASAHRPSDGVLSSMDLTNLALSSALARFPLLTAAVLQVPGRGLTLGAGLWLTRTDVSLGSVAGCVGCGGGPCNPCASGSGRWPRTRASRARPALRAPAVRQPARRPESGSAA